MREMEPDFAPCLCQWFNLDSIITGPELVSDTYLNLLLEQLRYEGWSHDYHMTITRPPITCLKLNCIHTLTP